MHRPAHAMILLMLALTGCPPVLAQDAPRYTVTFVAGAQRADVRLCLAKAHADVTFGADSGWAMRFIDAPGRDGGGNVTAGERGWNAADWKAGECLRYHADLRAIAQEHKPDVGWQLGSDFIAAPQLWLLRPDVQGKADAELRIELPAS